MKQKYFIDKINWYNNENARKYIKKFSYFSDSPYYILGFMRNGKVIIFINQAMNIEKLKIPYFFVQDSNGVRFRVDYKFRLIDKEYKRYYETLKEDIIEFMNLEYIEDSVHGIFAGIKLYSHFHFNWTLHQIKENPFTKIYWNNILFNRYNKKHFPFTNNEKIEQPKYFDININWYGNSNAKKFIQKFYGIDDKFFILGFIEDGTVAIFISEEIYHEKLKIPYFYVQDFDGIRFRVNYRFKLIDKKYKDDYNYLKDEIIEFMNLKFTKDGLHNLFNNTYLYSYFNFNWNLHQTKNNPFTKIFWNNILFNRYNKKHFLKRKE